MYRRYYYYADPINEYYTELQNANQYQIVNPVPVMRFPHLNIYQSSNYIPQHNPKRVSQFLNQKSVKISNEQLLVGGGQGNQSYIPTFNQSYNYNNLTNSSAVSQNIPSFGYNSQSMNPHEQSGQEGVFNTNNIYYETQNNLVNYNDSIAKLNTNPSNVELTVENADFGEEVTDYNLTEAEYKLPEKRNLIFEEKKISPVKLYCHLSYTTEVILMVFGTIFALGAGVGAPLMFYLFGDIINDFNGVNLDPELTMILEKILTIPEEEFPAFAARQGHLAEYLTNAYYTAKQLFASFDENIDDMVYTLLYIGVAEFVCFAVNKFFWCFVGIRMLNNLKRKYFAVILKQEQGWFDANNAYEFATKVQAQFEQIQLGLGEKMGVTLFCVGGLITGLVISFYTTWLLTLVMLAMSPLIFSSVLFLVLTIRKPIIGARKMYEKAGGAAEEMLYNIKTVCSFSNYEFEINRFNAMIDIVHEFDREKAWKFGLSLGSLLFFIWITFFVAVVYTRKLIGDEVWNDNKGEPFTIGACTCCVFCTLTAILSIGFTAPNLKIIYESAIASSDYFTLVERKPEIDLTNSTERPPRDQVRGLIEFKDVCFYYPSDPTKRQILNNINLTIEPGKKVAIVGESGCGKSTTVNLIERLYERTGGELLIDGIDIKNYDLPYLRSLIGYVQQEPVLFNKSIKENVIFGRQQELEKLGDVDTLVNSALEESYASEFINKNQDGVNYVVGIKGGKLSGGQKQRVAIARAILCKPKILILDEATSALDLKSEKEVQRALDNISGKNVTTIIIAHRLSTIKNADLIYAIRDGEVIEKGTHEELLALQGYYYGLVKSQVGQELEEAKNLETGKIIQEHISDTNERVNYKDVQAKHEEMIEAQGVQHGEICNLLKDNKCDLAMAITGTLCAGAVTPVTGYVLARAFGYMARGHHHDVWHNALKWSFIFLAVAFVNGFSVFIKLMKLETIGSAVTCNMRKHIVRKYLSLHISYFDIDFNAPGALLTKLSIDTIQLNSIILTLVGDVCQTCGNTIVGLIIGMIYEWRLALMSVGFIPFIVITTVIGKDSMRNATRKKDNRTDIEAGAILSESVINTKTIFSFNFQDPVVAMYLEFLKEETSEHIFNSAWKGFFFGLGAFSCYACCACIFHFAKEYIINFTLTFDDFLNGANTILLMIAGISIGLNGVSDYPKAKQAFISVFKTMRTPSKIPPFKEDNVDKISPENIQGKIEFRNVTFAYPTKPDIDVLKNVSFTIYPGQMVGLVGYSGCGKSTIIQLIERFYEVERGEILIDDINIKEYDIYHLRKKIGLVSQEPVLFKRSVYENIKYGRLDASKGEILSAAKSAMIQKFFTKKEMGTKEDPVSGGEKQRLAIARAFLKNPVILLLDEATSALDKESEKGVQESIDVLQKGRTSIAVAHRLSTIKDSDIIFVMENGRLVEQGNHDQLMKLDGKYANLYKYSDQ